MPSHISEVYTYRSVCGAVGVGEHDEGASDREVKTPSHVNMKNPVKNEASRKAEERSGQKTPTLSYLYNVFPGWLFVPYFFPYCWRYLENAEAVAFMRERTSEDQQRGRPRVAAPTHRIGTARVIIYLLYLPVTCSVSFSLCFVLLL